MQTTSKKVVRHTTLALVAATGLAAVVLAPSWMERRADADGEPTTQLVVKCAPGKVKSIVAHVTSEGGTVYDLATMAPLRPAKSVDTELPALESAVPVWQGVRDALSSTNENAGKQPVSLSRVYIEQRRMSLTLETLNVKMIEALTRALLDHPTIAKRIEGANRPVERGAVRKDKTGAWRAEITVHFGRAAAAKPPAEDAEKTITIDALHDAALKAHVEQVYASNEHLESHRGTGVASIWRAVTYRNAEIDGLAALLRELEAIAGVRVAVIRLSVRPDGDAEFDKVNVRVARRIRWRP